MCDMNTVSNGLNSAQSVGNNSTTGWNIASTALQIGSSIFGGLQQQKQADRNNEAITANYQAQLGQLQTQQRQIDQGASQQRSQIAQSVSEKIASLSTALGEAGVSGNTAARLTNTVSMQGNNAETNVETNRFNRIAQTGLQAQSLKAQADSSMRPDTDWIGTGLQIGGEVLDFGAKLTKKPTSPYRVNSTGGRN